MQKWLLRTFEVNGKPGIQACIFLSNIISTIYDIPTFSDIQFHQLISNFTKAPININAFIDIEELGMQNQNNTRMNP